MGDAASGSRTLRGVPTGSTRTGTASTSSSRRMSSSNHVTAVSTALALRLVFDTSSSRVLSGYRRRLKAVSTSLTRRGHNRLGALVCDKIVTRGAVCALALTVAGTVYVSRNKTRWHREHEMRNRREVLRLQLDEAASYEAFAKIARRMERLEEQFNENPELFGNPLSCHRVTRTASCEQDESDGDDELMTSQNAFAAPIASFVNAVKSLSDYFSAPSNARAEDSKNGSDDESESETERGSRSFLASIVPSKVRAMGLRRSGGFVPKTTDRESREKTPSETPGAKKKKKATKTKKKPTNRKSDVFDKELIEEQLRLLRLRRASGDVEEMMFGLRADILRNIGNIGNLGRTLHEQLWGVPKCVREYIDETREQLRLIAREGDLPVAEKLAFLQETRHCFGRTALLLSGGGTLGTFHVGVARALSGAGCLPRVLVGSSVGSIVAAIVASRCVSCRAVPKSGGMTFQAPFATSTAVIKRKCTTHSTNALWRPKTPNELTEFFSEEHFWDLLPDMTFFSGRDFFTSMQHLVRTGALHDIDFFQRCLRALLGDLTFQEAYDRSGGRILCVCVCATRAGEKPRLLNYLTSPNLVVWSAVAASCAFPSLFQPQPLLAKSRNESFVPWQPEGKLGPRRWRDGSLENDLPMRDLSELFNVNYFLVSQTNPHIVPILRVKRWFTSLGPGCGLVADFLESEWKHRCKQILALVPWADTFDLAKLFGQEWEGDVTVVMRYGWRHMKQIASNPTRDFLYETATMGEREMWPKLATIVSNCAIEMELDDCVKALRERLTHTQGLGLKQRGRVPSWNTVTFCGRDSYMHMPLSGGAHNGSSGNVLQSGSQHGNNLGHVSSQRPPGNFADAATDTGSPRFPVGGGEANRFSIGAGEMTTVPHPISASQHPGNNFGPVSRTSSCGSLSEFVAVVVSEESKRRSESGGDLFSKGRVKQPSAGANAATGKQSEEKWPLHQKMPTALMRIGSVKLGASAELLPEVFGKNAETGG